MGVEYFVERWNIAQDGEKQYTHFTFDDEDDAINTYNVNVSLGGVIGCRVTNLETGLIIRNWGRKH